MSNMEQEPYVLQKAIWFPCLIKHSLGPELIAYNEQLVGGGRWGKSR